MQQRFFERCKDGFWRWSDDGGRNCHLVTQESVKECIECHGLNANGLMVYRTTDYIRTEFGPMKVMLTVAFKDDTICEVHIKEPSIGIKLIENISSFVLDKHNG